MAFADTAKVVVDLDLDNKGLIRGAKQASSAMRKYGESVKKTGQQMTRLQRLQAKAGSGGIFGSLLTGVGIGGGMMAFQAGINAAKAAVNLIGDATTAAKEEDAAIENLTRSLELNAKGWDRNYDAVEAWVGATQEATAVGDGELRPALSLLLAATNDVTDAQELMAGALDFARGAGIDLMTAVKTVTQGLRGQFGMFSRYGIAVQTTGTNMERLSSVFDKFQGQAVTFARSDAGQAELATLAWGDAMESLGRLFTGVGGDIDDLSKTVANTLDKAFTDALDPIEDVTTALKDFQYRAQQVQEDLIPSGGGNPFKGTILDRDLINDAMNLSRIGLSGGVLAVTDAIGEHGGGWDDLWAPLFGMDDITADRVASEGLRNYEDAFTRVWTGSTVPEMMTSAIAGAGVGIHAGQADWGDLFNPFKGMGKAITPRGMVRDLNKQLRIAIRQVDKVIADPDLLNKPVRKMRRQFTALMGRIPAAMDTAGIAGPLITQFIAATGQEIEAKEGALEGDFGQLGIAARDGFFTEMKAHDWQVRDLMPTNAKAQAEMEGATAGLAWFDGWERAVTAKMAMHKLPTPGPQGYMPARPSPRSGFVVSARDTAKGGNKVTTTTRYVHL